MKPVFLNNWSKDGMFGLIADFSGIYLTKAEYDADKAPYANVEYWYERKAEYDDAVKNFQGFDVILASYGNGCYCGDSFVLIRKDGELMEVNAAHCSCYGLEGQWRPESTTIESLRHRIERGCLGSDDYTDNQFKNELIAVLDELEKEST